MLQPEPTRQSGGRILSSLGESVFFLLRPSTDQTRPTHIMEANVFYSKSTDLNVNLILKNAFTAVSESVFGQISGNGDLAKLTHRINHHVSSKRHGVGQCGKPGALTHNEGFNNGHQWEATLPPITAS